MNSLNHYAYGAIVEWIYETVCGIKPDETEAGFKKAVISPSFDKRIEKSECIFDSASGIYRIASELTGEKENIAKLQVEVPFNCKAEFIVPDGYVMLSINGNKESMKKIIMEKGKYEIVMKKSQKHIV
ncbi:MAG: alpha-L-rhamnosidase C-terminal domain-containing protein [Lachnospiraceae bacterium]